MAATALMDRGHRPTEHETLAALGPSAPLWERLTRYLDEAYGIEPTFAPHTQKRGQATR